MWSYVASEKGFTQEGRLSESNRDYATMGEERLNETAESSKVRQRYRKSQVIFEEGSTGSEMYLIYSGKVLLSVRSNETEQTPLVVLNPGDFFGEMALVDDSPRSATASAMQDDTELIVMDRTRFMFMVRQQPEFALSLMHTLCQRLRDMDKRLSPGGVPL
jgi:CRP-like cAMP-binding protein